MVDGTLKNVEKAKTLINHLDDKGYKVNVLIKTCPKDVSLKSIEQRYQHAINEGKTPRYVPKDVHDAVVAVLPKNGHELYNYPKVNKLEVHNRKDKVFDSKQDKSSPRFKILGELNANCSKKINSPSKSQSLKKDKGFSR